MTTEARHVLVIGYEQAELLDIACVVDTLSAANRLGAEPPYRVQLASPNKRPIHSAGGLVLAVHTGVERVRGRLDTLVVVGGPGHAAAADDAGLVRHVAELAARSRRVASVCTGSSILAAAGLLDGRRATTHWAYARDLADRHPAVTVDARPLYIIDGDVCTSAGVTSALDLTLALVEVDHGPELARSIARWLVTYMQRPGNQAQLSIFVTAKPPSHQLLRETVQYITSHLDGDLTTATLATRVGVSERHLCRLFLDQLGQPPARFIRTARTEAAARLLESTSLPLATVARRCGFGSTETLRQAFQARYASAPSAHRAAFRTAHHPPEGGGRSLPPHP
ncbi:GlxA family transcriptional regulator [Kitasatospora sp. NPDC052896]|uniref:GlxA family transcriptional regulator n=1 Tax=Kitasatospora sp. NPDC052896 TaxID=3364061 RepID=UPI0037C94066